MQYSKISDLPIIEEHEAEGEVAKIFESVKRDMEVPFVPNVYKGLAINPGALKVHYMITKTAYENAILPESVIEMILFAIAESNNCEYCSAGHELSCRTLGIDEITLRTLVEDLDNVSPERIRSIIGFALKVAHDPQGLVAEDYERVREKGVTDAELVEIIILAALGTYGDILADALKIDVEPMISRALGN